MKKSQIISLIIIIIVFISFLVIFKYKKNESDKQYLYLLTGDEKAIGWYYNKNTWYILNNNNILKEKFDVYADGKYSGNYNLVYNKKWYYFDDKNKSKQILGDIFMINTTYDFKSYSINNKIIDSEKIITALSKTINDDLNEYDYSLYNVETNNENFKNKIYYLNAQKESMEVQKISPDYSIVFMYENNKIYVIKSADPSEDDLARCSLSVSGIFSFIKKDNILIRCSHYDQIPSDYYLYELDNKKFKLVVDSVGGI